MTTNPYRHLPSVDLLVGELLSNGVAIDRPHLTKIVQGVLGGARRDIAADGHQDASKIRTRIEREIESFERPRLRPIINATGVLLHTNLGRSPVSPATGEAMRTAATGYVALELDPETNRRGGRFDEIAVLLGLLTGAEATLVVNNNAAAVLLTLSALAQGREVLVARSDAVEIGGGFRIPDVLQQSGARLVDVGTTNRTYAHDYAAAVTQETAAILRVHASNFTIHGFIARPSTAELAMVAREAGIPLIEDVGSGSLLQPADFGLGHEPTIGEQIAAGADVVTASGDKLLGGPQAGIIVGRASLLARIERHPLARAVRADKTCLTGLAETLRHYLRGEAEFEIPIWRAISTPLDALRARAASILSAGIGGGIEMRVVDTLATVGGGSLPGRTLPSAALELSGMRAVDDIARDLRIGAVGVHGRIAENRLLLDLRSVLPEQDDDLTGALEALSGRGSSPSRRCGCP